MELVSQDRLQYIQKQQRWLLFLRHCAKCERGEDECCLGASRKAGKALWDHILNCMESKCPYPRCTSSKDLLKHHQECKNSKCPICAPVREYVHKNRTFCGQEDRQEAQGTPLNASST